MSRYVFAIASLFALAATLASAQTPTPSLVPPAVPAVAALLNLPAEELASGYLAANTALPLADAARQAQGVLTIGIDGQAYTVNSANAAQFITFLKARLDVYGQAITKRGSKLSEGLYTLATGAGCKGERFDPRFIFSSGKGPNGQPLMATSARVVQNGVETDLLVTLSQGRQVLGEILSGVAVDDILMLSDVMSDGFSLYGTISGNTIELRLDADEVKNALGADVGTDADWKLVPACVFTLTKR